MIGSRFITSARQHARDESGASIVEYTVVIILFLLVFFAILDFGRLGFNWVMTEKAMQRAARIAVTRPPVCAGVPDEHARNGASTAAFGTLCRTGGAGNSDCATPANDPQQCVLSAGAIDCGAANVNSDTATEIWCILEPILPSNATPQNIAMTYSFDENLGFVGGPYTPMVEVGVVTGAMATAGLGQELRFEFITPIPALIAMAGSAATPSTLNEDTAGGAANGLADIPFPDLSVSMPGEDLNQGNNG